MELHVRGALATDFDDARVLMGERALERRAEPLNVSRTLV
jgi:hypothetical protein